MKESDAKSNGLLYWLFESKDISLFHLMSSAAYFGLDWDIIDFWLIHEHLALLASSIWYTVLDMGAKERKTALSSSILNQQCLRQV